MAGQDRMQNRRADRPPGPTNALEEAGMQRGLTTTSNWINGPFNRWGFRHVRELTRTARVGRGFGPVSDLPPAEHDLSDFSFAYGGRRIGFDRWLEETFTDGLLVVRDGKVLSELYQDGMSPSDTHLIMSASKSFTSILCGVLVGHGSLHTGSLVTEHLPELVGTSWDGCTLQHLLDMRAGTAWDYDVDEYTALDISDYRFHERNDIPEDTQTWIRTIGNTHAHGGPFHYSSLMTSVLGWILERAAGASFPELFSREIWSRMGAEQDADLVVDASGFPLAEGGFCTTLRDFARFGLMCLQGGEIGGQRVVPAEWLARLRVRDQELIDAYANSPEYDADRPDAFYRDCWWVSDAEKGIYEAAGMSGQELLIHHPSRTVIAKLSTHPTELDPELWALQYAGMIALCEYRGDESRVP